MTATPHPIDSQASRLSALPQATSGSFGFWYVAATVAGFLVFWPVGLALLAWAFWRDEIRASSLWQKMRGVRAPVASDFTQFMGRRPSNAALAEYLAREQQRLREEQGKLDELVRAFEAFKDAERQANDQRDFEAFLRQRERDGRDGSTTTIG